jgi:hypothetical protein
MKVVKTVHDLVMALGGFTRVARWAGYEDARGVHNWLTRGIPPSYHLRLTLEAKRRGVEIDPSVFGLEDNDADELRGVFERTPPTSLRARA